MSARVLFDPEDGARVPLLLWAHDASRETLRQLARVAAMPYVVGHVAAMADAHMSSGVAVGTVFATDDAVVPGALGGDIGCGMCAVRLRGDLDARALDRRTLTRIVEGWRAAIPTGDETHRGKGVTVPDGLLASNLSTRELDRVRARLAPRHLGTLGGGNHFVELDRDPEGTPWLLVHSGSRGLGAAIARHHAGATGSADPLAPLSTTDLAGSAYLEDHAWAIELARRNRLHLAHVALDVIANVTGAAFDPIDADEPVDVPHNFVRRERWLDRDLLIHRKGAAPAALGTLALVPGSMGTASYIVEGLGAHASFGSCSHGAGRVMSRAEARREIRVGTLTASMRRVVFPEEHARDLVEEAPAAYRDIRAVLDAQRDLVVPKVRLEPMAVLKG